MTVVPVSPRQQVENVSRSLRQLAYLKQNFLKNSKVFNELKLRASYGQTGNQEGIRHEDYIQLLKFRDDGWGTKLIYPFGNGSQSRFMA